MYFLRTYMYTYDIQSTWHMYIYCTHIQIDNHLQDYVYVQIYTCTGVLYMHIKYVYNLQCL